MIPHINIFLDWFGRLGSLDYASLFINLLDVFLVAFVIYKLIMLVKGTRAWQIILGLGVFFLLVLASYKFHLTALNWLLRQILPLGPVALVILFYPELRSVLEEIGRLRFLGRGFVVLEKEDLSNLIEQLTKVVADMSKARVGALIVIEREVGLSNVIANGRKIDALASADLIRTIFHPGSPLHDGAIIIRGNRIIAASCTLPLSDSPRVGTMIHTRHKAALGVSEESDAVVLVVSEETGLISLSIDGDILRGLLPEQVHAKLVELLQGGEAVEGVQNIKRTVSTAFSKMRAGSASEQKQNVKR
ncbi:MAG: diadenylate cyclase CdaA [Armatimonadota bacterium]|jgi:diadenylate cyclase